MLGDKFCRGLTTALIIFNSSIPINVIRLRLYI